MKKPNLLILCHELSPIGGGAGNFACHLSGEFARLGYFSRIVIITSNYRWRYPFVEMNKGVTIYRLPVFRKDMDRTNAFELVCYAVFSFVWAALLSMRYRFKFTLAVHGIPSGVSAYLLSKVARVPYGVSLRGGDVPGFLPQRYAGFHKKISFVTRSYWKNSGFITFNVKGLYDLTKGMADRLNKNIRIIPNGVDSDFFRPPQNRDFSIINILYSGRLTEQKNIPLLIKGVAALLIESSRSSVPFRLHIAGDGDSRKALELLVRSLGLEDYVRFHGWLDRGRLKTLYQSSHIFVLPSLYEGMSNSLLEALSCGLAVISTDFSGYDSLIREGENGYLIPSGDLKALSERMLYLLNNTRVIESMCRKSREAALNFSWASVAREYLDLIAPHITNGGN